MQESLTKIKTNSIKNLFETTLYKNNLKKSYTTHNLTNSNELHKLQKNIKHYTS